MIQNNKAILWVKQNKFTASLIAVVLYFIIKFYFGGIYGVPVIGNMMAPNRGHYAGDYEYGAPLGMSKSSSYMGERGGGAISDTAQYESYTGAADMVQDRMVVTSSNISVLVENTKTAMSLVKNKTREVGGFVVTTNMYSPVEYTSGDITIRIPLDQMDSFIEYLSANSVRVVSQNVNGYDVTDQYVDNDARLATLNKTKARYEQFFDQATDVDELLRVQSKILEVQRQIDSIKGSQKMLETTSKIVLLGVSISEDEMALPYAPAEPWSPQNIFKLAVRSLISTLRALAGYAIWLAVYLPLIAAAVITFKLVKKGYKKVTIK